MTENSAFFIFLSMYLIDVVKTPPVIVMDNAILSQARMKEEGWATGLLPVPVKKPQQRKRR